MIIIRKEETEKWTERSTQRGLHKARSNRRIGCLCRRDKNKHINVLTTATAC